jgi:hypothetical protein
VDAHSFQWPFALSHEACEIIVLGVPVWGVELSATCDTTAIMITISIAAPAMIMPVLPSIQINPLHQQSLSAKS